MTNEVDPPFGLDSCTEYNTHLSRATTVPATLGPFHFEKCAAAIMHDADLAGNNDLESYLYLASQYAAKGRSIGRRIRIFSDNSSDIKITLFLSLLARCNKTFYNHTI